MARYLCLLVCVTSIAQAQIEIPSGPEGQIVSYVGYTLSYNEEHEQANWVAYELTAQEVQGIVSRSDDFRADPEIRTGSATLVDYRGSGYDRGHLAPAADMKWSEEAMSESFYMSNMSPQVSGFNRGIWKSLENRVRSWAVENTAVYVVTGGILSSGLPTIGPDSVSVPEYFYKVILDYQEPELKGIGFILSNQGSKSSLKTYAVSIDSVEQRTGIDFFPSLPDDMEERLESSIDLTLWGFPTGEGN